MGTSELVEKINQIRETVAWWIHPYTSREEAYKAQCEVTMAIFEAEQKTLMDKDTREKIKEIGEAHHEFRQTLGGRFEPVLPEYHHTPKIAVQALLSAVGGAVIKAALEEDEEASSRD